jgi:hypothetical protein
MKTYKVTVDDYGTKYWYLNDQLHREGGPAIESANGIKWWYINDKLHREGGPAIESANGIKWWYLNGQRHREDGPAVEWASGDKYWYLNGEELTEAEFNACINKQPSCDGRVVEIDGKKYKLQGVK